MHKRHKRALSDSISDLEFSSLLCFSEKAWDGLEKPVGRLEGHSFAECCQACSDLGDNCGLIHSHRGLKTCTPAKELGPFYFKLASQFFYPQIDCVAVDHQIRNKNTADGSIPCPGEIGVYLFDEIKPCGEI